MKSKTLLAAIVLLLFLVPVMPRRAESQNRGRHPHYLMALADLRLARGYLDKLTPSEHIDMDQDHAVHELEMAISQIKAAAIDDGKDMRDHPPIDANIRPGDRFQRAHDALDAAMHDVQQAEDDPETRDLRGKIVDHVSRAISYVRDIQKRTR